MAAPQVGQGTNMTCFGVSSRLFTRPWWRIAHQKNAQYCSSHQLWGSV